MLKNYFVSQCKRILRLFPRICIVTFVVMIIGICLVSVNSKDKDSQNGQLSKMNVGIVATEGDKWFIDFGMQFIENSDDLKYICDFQNVTEEDGQKMLETEELDVLVIFPDDYVESVYYGVEEPIILRYGKAQAGVSSLFFKRLSDAISQYMMEAKAGIYAMQDMYENWDINYKSHANQLTERYIMKILSRKNILETEIISSTGSINEIVYYGAAGLVLVFLLWGLNCGSILGKKEDVLSLLLMRRGLSFFKQFICRSGALFLLFLLNYMCIVGIVLVVAGFFSGYVGNYAAVVDDAYSLSDIINVSDFVVYIKIIPVILMACFLVLVVYEAFDDGISAMLFMFFFTVIMAFLSGFFYPASFFPEWVQYMGHILPTGVMHEYIVKCVSNEEIGVSLLKILFYCIFFIAFQQIRAKYRGVKR